MPEETTILVKAPDALADRQLLPFVYAALQIGVVREGLEQRIRRAHRLIYLFSGERLIGVAAVKRPAQQYQRRIFEQAGCGKCVDAYPFEFGWLFVLPGARGGNHVDRLAGAGREAAGGQGLFATVRADGRALLRIARRNGYVPLGRPYRSHNSGERLALIGIPPETP